MADDGDKLTEEEAARVWEQAARLQAESDGAATALTVSHDDDGPPPPSYALTHVRSAAEGAGIAHEFVESALADLRVERFLPPVEKSHALARRFLHEPPNTVAVQRVIDASIEDVLRAMQAVLPAEPFGLVLTDQQGDPMDGGVLIFDLPGIKSPFERGFAFAAADAGLRQLFVSLRAMEGPTPACEVSAHSPVTSHNLGFGVGMILSTVSGGAGLGVLGAVGLAIGIGPVGAVGGLVLGAGLGVKGFRALYHSSMGKARKALDGLLGAVAVRATGVWGG